MKRKVLLGLACLSLFAGVAFAKRYKITTGCGTESGMYAGDMSRDDIREYAKFVHERDCGTEDGIIMIEEI